MYGAFKMNMDDAQSGKVGMDKVSGEFLIEQEQKTLGFLVVSVDGDPEAPVAKLLDLPSTEYEAVIKEMNAIQNPTSQEKSEQLGTDTSRTA
jgi:hypothetical protein